MRSCHPEAALSEQQGEVPKQPAVLPNGVVPHPQDIVFLLECMKAEGVHPGFVRIRAADGGVETFGFDVTDQGAWATLEKLNPAIVKLCRGAFALEWRLAHARREAVNIQEAANRSIEVLMGKRAPAP